MAYGDHRRSTRRYTTGAEVAVTDLAPSSGVVASTGAAAELQRVHYDTGDFALLRHGITVASSIGADRHWSLVFPGTLGQLDLTVTSGDPGTVPKEVLDRVRVYVRDRPLKPVAHLTLRRQVTTLTAPDGAPALRVLEDVVAARSGSADAGLAGEAAERSKPAEWKEWTLESAEDSGDGADTADGLLDAVESRLLDAGAVRDGHVNRLDGAAGRPEEVDSTDPEGSLQTVLGAAFRAAAAELALWDLQVRAGEEDAIHQLRVRSRTLRSMLKTYEKLLDKEAARDLEARLQRLGRSLSAARDAEVMHERVHQSAGAHPEGTIPGHVVRRLEKKATVEYHRASAAVLEDLNSPDYFRTLAALDGFVARLPLRSGTEDGRDAREPLRKAAKRQRHRVRLLIAAADRETDADARLSLLHEVRKKSKRLRYALRAVSGSADFTFGRRLEAVLAASEDIQDALGAHRDSVLFQQYVAQTAREAHSSGANTFGYGVLHQAEVPRQAAATESYRQAAQRLN